MFREGKGPVVSELEKEEDAALLTLNKADERMKTRRRGERESK